MAWWLWLLLGLALLLLELLTPSGFYLLFFGIGALITGALVLAGLGGPDWLQWTAFSVLSLLSLLLFRKPLLSRYKPKASDTDLDTLVGETALVLDEVPIDGFGRAELRGSTWQVRNVGGVPLVARQRCRVERVDGLVLCIRAA